MTEAAIRVPEASYRLVTSLTVALAIGAVAGTWAVTGEALFALGAAMTPLVATLVLRYPFALSLGFIIFSFFRLHEVLPVLMPFRLPSLLAVGSIGALACHLLCRQIRVFWCREFTLLLLFALHMAVGVVFSPNPRVSIQVWTDSYVKIIIMVFAIAYLTRGAREFARMGTSLILAGILVSGAAINNWMHGIDLVEGSRASIGRTIGSVLGDPNDLSLVLLFPAAFAATWLTAPGMRPARRMLGALGIAAAVWAIICTQSRGGLLGMVSVLGMVGMRFIRSKLLLAGIGVVVLPILFAVAGISERASGGAHEEGIDESAEGRLLAWMAAVNMALDHPIFGVGLENFVHLYFFYTPEWKGIPKVAHSTWFTVLGEGGFLGLGLFLCLVVWTFRRSLRTQRMIEAALSHGAAIPPIAVAVARALPAGLVGFAVSGSFLTQAFTWPFYIQLALTVAAARFTESFLPPGWPAVMPAAKHALAGPGPGGAPAKLPS